MISPLHQSSEIIMAIPEIPEKFGNLRIVTPVPQSNSPQGISLETDLYREFKVSSRQFNQMKIKWDDSRAPDTNNPW